MKRLTSENLNLPKEKKYFMAVVIFSLAIWTMVAVSVLGLILAMVMAVVLWFANGLLVAKLKSDCALIDQNQLSDLYETYVEVCKRLDIAKIPELYVLQGGGALNAFGLRHVGRNFVVVYSDALEAFGPKSDEIKFLLGHELGHIKSWHILKQLLLMPGMFVPLIGPAYSRACEASCDRYGAFAADNIDSAIKAIMVFSGGRQIGKQMSAEAFSDQHCQHRGFFISWYELISGYPTASQRVTLLRELKSDAKPENIARHPLAYLFAMFSFGGHASGAGNFIVTVIIVGMAAVIVIPKALQSQVTRRNETAQKNLTLMADAVEVYAKKNNGKYPIDLKYALPEEYSLKEDLCGKHSGGFLYSCFVDEQGYEFTATPSEPGKSGTESYVVNPEGMMILNGTDVEFVDGNENAEEVVEMPSDSVEDQGIKDE